MALRVLVVVMGLMIVAGLGVVVVTIVARSGTTAMVRDAVLDEPAGTRIAGASAAGDRLVLTLQGGGPDRVVVVAAGRVVSRVSLGR